MPCPVVRMLTGNTSEGSTKVVMFGPNSKVPMKAPTLAMAVAG